MKTDELVRLALSNLWRTKLRTFLTTSGVVIGIGALVSMVSFGTGMQKNITEMFEKNDLFTSLQVLPQKINLEEAMHGDFESVSASLQKESRVITDSTLNVIQLLSGVEIAYPEIGFPVKIEFRGKEAQTSLKGLPVEMGKYKPFNELAFGHFFQNSTDKTVILDQNILRNLNIIIRDPFAPDRLSLEDSLRGIRTLPPDSLIGKEIQIITSVIDISTLIHNPAMALTFTRQMPFTEKSTVLRIIGIQKASDRMFEGRRYQGNVIAPIETVEKIPRLGFSSVWDLLGRKEGLKGYSSLYVRVKRMEDLEPVKKAVDEMGFGTLAVADQLQEIKKGFIIFDTALGAVGTIALIVAALGIINTMVMSILERTREIGIMKAIGGSENEIKGIFFVEAGMIGFLGGIFGLILGWIVTRIANLVANHYIAQQGGPLVNFFYIPLWLILGAVAFSILVSLLAGLYPAIRAARVNPVEALRHD